MESLPKRIALSLVTIGCMLGAVRRVNHLNSPGTFMSLSSRMIEVTLAIAAVSYAMSCFCDNVVYSRDPTDPAAGESSVDADMIRGLISRRKSEANLVGSAHPSVVSIDKQIEELRARANLPPHWPDTHDRLRSYRATGLTAPTIDALVDRVLLLEAEVRELKSRVPVKE